MKTKEKSSVEELNKLSLMFQIPIETLLFLDNRWLLDHTEVRNIAIKHDYEELVKQHNGETLMQKKIFDELAFRYHISVSKIKFVVYDKRKYLKYCSNCGVRISKFAYVKNDGMCDKCSKLQKEN